MRGGTVMRHLGTALVVLAAASIAVTGLALGARLSWLAELFTHFRVQLVAGQLVLIGLLLAARRRRWTLAVALCAGVNAWYVHPVVWPGSPARAVPAAGAELSVMTVNVSARNERTEPLLAMIERERPDVVVVVELTPRWHRRLQPLEESYAFRDFMPTEDAFGLGLLSRYPVEVLSRDKLGATAAIDARVAGPNGPFRVLGVHLKPPMSRRLAAERNRQLVELAERRARIDEPLIVLGDFNVSPYSPYYGDWIAATALHDTLAGQGPSATWPSFMPLLGIPIDHCFVSRHFSVLGRRHLSEFGSDHYPVLVRLLHGTTR